VPELPAGTVTFLFTDVEGSTRLLDELGDEYANVLDDHRRSLRHAFSRHGGVEVDTQGDAFFIAFPRAKDALVAAAEARDALAPGRVRVRIGLHTGEPLLTPEGYVGIDVHRAARIAAVGHGVFGLALLAWTAAQHNDAERAGTLRGAIEAEEGRGRLGRWESDQRDDFANRLHVVAGPAFERGRNAGRSLSLDEAVAYALE
jgi:class 3 adenylate cyclase